MRKTLMAIVIGVVATVAGAGPALACGGLIGRNGSVNLVRTTTLAAWHDGVEHYVTAFKFAGAGGEFGSIIPLPDVPTSVERGGDWTLQRLVREVTPVRNVRPGRVAGRVCRTPATRPRSCWRRASTPSTSPSSRAGARRSASGPPRTASCSPPTPPRCSTSTPRAARSSWPPSSTARRLSPEGVAVGDGTPVHLTIPTANPWVPLRILGVGLKPAERVNADVFLLTDKRPALLPGNSAPGMVLDRQAPATNSLLTDLRSDKGMEWVPQSMWLSYLKIDAAPGQLTYDLAVDATGADKPSARAAGLDLGQPVPPEVVTTDDGSTPVLPWALAGAAVLALAAGGVLVARRR